MSTSVKFVDNSKAILNAVQQAEHKALAKIGAAARDHTRENLKGYNIAGGTETSTGDTYRSANFNVKPEDKSVDIGVETFYSSFIELGTVKMRARPFLKPAIMDNISEYQKIVTETLGEGVKVAAGGLSTTSTYYQDDPRVTNV